MRDDTRNTCGGGRDSGQVDNYKLYPTCWTCVHTKKLVFLVCDLGRPLREMPRSRIRDKRDFPAADEMMEFDQPCCDPGLVDNTKRHTICWTCVYMKKRMLLACRVTIVVDHYER